MRKHEIPRQEFGPLPLSAFVFSFFVLSVRQEEVWWFLFIVRNGPWQLLVRQVANRASGGVTRRAKPWKAKVPAVTQVNLVRPRDT